MQQCQTSQHQLNNHLNLSIPKASHHYANNQQATPKFMQTNNIFNCNPRSSSQPNCNSITQNNNNQSNAIRAKRIFTSQRSKPQKQKFNGILQGCSLSQVQRSKDKANRAMSSAIRSQNKDCNFYSLKKEVIKGKDSWQEMLIQKIKIENSKQLRQPPVIISQGQYQIYLNKQLSKTENEINIIKLQIQRYKKCQQIHHQNSSLLNKISQKMKSTRKNLYYQQKKQLLMKKPLQRRDQYTPINSLNQIKINSQSQVNQNSKFIGKVASIKDNLNNQPNSTVSLKTIHEDNSFKTATEGIQQVHHKTLVQSLTMSDDSQNKFKEINILLSKENKRDITFQYQSISKRLLQINRFLEQRVSNMNFNRKNLTSSRQFSTKKSSNSRNKYTQNLSNQSKNVPTTRWYKRNNISQF